MQPDDVGVLKLLEHFELIYDRVVGVATRGAKLSSSKQGFVHLLDRKLLVSVRASREVDFGKATLANPLDLFVPVDLTSLLRRLILDDVD